MGDGEIEGMGPVLFFRAHEAGRLRLAAIAARPEGCAPGRLRTGEGEVEAERIATRLGLTVWRWVFDLPARDDAWYELEGVRRGVAADPQGDLRLAYVSCNGQENGDLSRPPQERNAMWRRLAERHAQAPFHLLMQGGDQIYADEVTLAHPLSAGWPSEVPGDPDEAALDGLAQALGDAFFDRYVRLLAQDGVAEVMAQVPSLSMWDDHDICDGWGSLPHGVQDTAVGRVLFAAAREAFLLFQCGARADEVPPASLDREGRSLGWSVSLPGLEIVAPDLRSERRREAVMGARGWESFERWAAGVSGRRVLMMSSVPVLGPRLSVVEALMGLTRRMESYEDDLRDQWQSRTHREEWRRMLLALAELHARQDTQVTVLSGEIHLATRGTLATRAGDLHQLVASGITHPPPPRAYALCLGALAKLGSSPLPRMPIAMRALPGQSTIYTAQRNYLRLERQDGEWRAIWELEHDGPSPALAI